jgi:hypothetical protein
MSELIAVSLMGFLSSAHCVGMCGGFAAAIGASDRAIMPVLARQLVYNLGRVFTYAFLGACGGFAGLYLSRFNSALITVQQLFSGAAGVTMLLVGVSLLGLRAVPRARLERLTSLFAPLFSHFLNARGGFFLAGLANGFLPCGLVYAFLALAVATGSVAEGMLTMTFFGAGTVPAMVLIGLGSALLNRTVRLRVMRLAACFIIIAGAVTITRAFPAKDNCHPKAQVSVAVRG